MHIIRRSPDMGLEGGMQTYFEGVYLRLFLVFLNLANSTFESRIGNGRCPRGVIIFCIDKICLVLSVQLYRHTDVGFGVVLLFKRAMREPWKT